jgi:hypothetical protein
LVAANDGMSIIGVATAVYAMVGIFMQNDASKKSNLMKLCGFFFSLHFCGWGHI